MTGVGGIVLCGGRSSRMGRPKAWLPIGDEVMLQRVVRIVGSVVSPVVVVAAPGQDVPPLPGSVRIVRDAEEGRGPLAGLAAGLTSLNGSCEVVYLSACDLPYLTSRFIHRVIRPTMPGHLLPEGEKGQDESEYDIAVPRVDGFLHPLAAAYRLSVRDTVLARLVTDQLRLMDLFQQHPTRILTSSELVDLESLRNVNSPDDYAAAVQWQRSHPDL